MRKQLLLLSSLAMTSTSAWAGFTSGDFSFEVTSWDVNAVVVTGCTGTGEVTIPKTVTNGEKTYNVTCVKNNAFEDATFTKITIPNTIDAIFHNAFHDCNRLKEVVIEDGTKALALSYDDYLENDGIFYDCDKLEKVYLGRDITPTTAANGEDEDATDQPRAFKGQGTLKEVVIGPTVTYIEGSLFYDCDALTTVDFSQASSLVHIWEKAFENCDALVTLNFTGATKLKIIHNYAFKDVDALTLLDLSYCTSLESIELEAFFDTNNLLTVKLPASIYYIGPDAFDHEGLTSSDVTSLYLYGDEEHKDVVLTDWDSDNFKNVECLYLDRIVKRGDGKWNAYPKVKTAYVGYHVPELPAGIFSSNTNLKEVTFLTDDEITIQQDAFKECTSLEAVNLLTPVLVKGDAFYGAGVKELTLNSDVKAEENAFRSLANLAKIYVDYDQKPTTALVHENAFDKERTGTQGATVFSIGRYNVINDLPWHNFFKRTSLSTTDVGYDRQQDIEQINKKTVNMISMPLADEATTAFMLSLPFEVSSYYFGADAKIYNLGALTDADIVVNNNDITFKLTPVDISATLTLPVNQPLLIVTLHPETEVKGTIDLFKRIDIQVEAVDFELDLSDEIYSVKAYGAPTTDWNETAHDVYLLEDGYLKLSNCNDKTCDAFTALMVDNESNRNKIMHLVDKTDSHELLSTGSAATTPNQYLEGYTTFYSSESHFIALPFTSAGNEVQPEVYTITGASDGMLELHQVTDGVINKGQGVLIKGVAAKELSMRMVTDGSADSEAYTTNILSGVDVATSVVDLSNDFIYVLSCNEDFKDVGFYKFSTGNTIGAHKAYIDPSKLIGNSQAVLRLPGVDGIETILPDSEATSPIYDLYGRQSSTTHENTIYIIDNKKTIQK